jgi:hypothetical protein
MILTSWLRSLLIARLTPGCSSMIVSHRRLASSSIRMSFRRFYRLRLRARLWMQHLKRKPTVGKWKTVCVWYSSFTSGASSWAFYRLRWHVHSSPQRRHHRVYKAMLKASKLKLPNMNTFTSKVKLRWALSYSSRIWSRGKVVIILLNATLWCKLCQLPTMIKTNKNTQILNALVTHLTVKTITHGTRHLVHHRALNTTKVSSQ